MLIGIFILNTNNTTLNSGKLNFDCHKSEQNNISQTL